MIDLHEKFNPENKKSPVRIPEFNRYHLANLFNEMGYKVGAEIGVERAVYSKAICRRVRGVKLYAIDAWEKYPEYTVRLHVEQERENKFHEETKKRLAEYNAEVIKAYSMDAVRDFENESLDFIYLDSNHEFDFVMEDLINWGRKVKTGGMISLHDYSDHEFINVIEVVNIYTRMNNVKEFFITDERTPSAFWVKE